jgi:hypothetical protein
MATPKRQTRKKEKSRTPVYFLSLTVENVRCFGPKQTIDLSDGNGRPAPWTIILGDNGVGKTTLLQCLAIMIPVEYYPGSFKPKHIAPKLSKYFAQIADWRLIRHTSLKYSVTTHFATYHKPTEAQENKESHLSISGNINSFVSNIHLDEALLDIACFAYGAGRRMSETARNVFGIQPRFVSL